MNKNKEMQKIDIPRRNMHATPDGNVVTDFFFLVLTVCFTILIFVVFA